MDFYHIKERISKKNTIEVYPDFIVCPSKDLMIRGKAFYAVWDEDRGLWSTEEYDVPRLVDKELLEYKEKIKDKTESNIHVKTMSDMSTNSWLQFKIYLGHIPDSSHQLDNHIAFQNTEVKKRDYVSKRLPYPLEKGSYSAFDEIISTLYDPEERAKIEWAIGSVVAGDAKDIQKFIVLYGAQGTGKGTIINIVQKLFTGYYTTFEAKALGSSNNSFSTEVFRSNPLVAIQHDGDLSRIEDNTKLNSIISHEEMTFNEKYKPAYTAKANCLLFMGTNRPVKISDAKSGIIRRLIDVRPSGRLLSPKKYQTLMAQVEFELGAIAFHCLEVYRAMGKNYYSSYRPVDMILQTDVFFNFVEANFHIFKEQDGIGLTQAYEMYKAYCDEALVDFKLPRYKFREEFKNYFNGFCDVTRVDGKQIRSYYYSFNTSKFTSGEVAPTVEEHGGWISLDETTSIFDDLAKDYIAQYASDKELPIKKWKEVTSHLSDLDTTKLHYVLVPINHIVIDFDIKDDSGEKSMTKNMDAANKWPPTYVEFSKSGKGLHLHYFYDGDTDKLSSVFDDNIEVKVFRVGAVGPSSLRRKLSRCNSYPITTINSGLPLKGEKVINSEVVKSEKGLRNLIIRNLRKEIHAGTKPSIDFINTILDDAYKSGLKYDVSDMRPKILSFAANSTHQSELCIKIVSQMKFKSEEASVDTGQYSSDTLVFYDVEVFPNLFLVNWKYQGADQKCVHMINPTSKDIESLFGMKLVGFNNRKYDNHILYARYIGYSIEEIYTLSQRIIGESRNAMFSEAYGISYTDIYDFASAANKKSLKKFEIELGIHHQELGLPWDKPVPEELWFKVVEYCDNDVIGSEAVFEYLSGDWTARKILAELSGLTVNDTTNQHCTKIIFGGTKNPQNQFVYTDLSDIFPGYSYSFGKSSYRDEDPGEGGYVYAEPGVYENVALLDVASMHPTSIEKLNLFGPFTRNFNELKEARLAIKHNDVTKLEKLLDGKLVPIVERAKTGEFKMSDLSNGLKTVINSVYGLTSAKFENPFKDPRNIDNIVAKRGALFMIELKHAVQDKGFTVAHIKTDSIKIPNATEEIIAFVFEFGQRYGYTFEHEATYDRFFLANDAVYIARYKDGKEAGKWTATGSQFAQPYVFKTLFSKEAILFEDMCETKAVTSALYLDMNENLPDVSEYDKEYFERTKVLENPNSPRKLSSKFRDLTDNELLDIISKGHDYHFIGKVGSFCPIKEGCGGGILLREKEGKYNAATGSKGYRWLEAEVVKVLDKEKDIDKQYYREMVDEAKKDIHKFVDFEWFTS